MDGEVRGGMVAEAREEKELERPGSGNSPIDGFRR
jgi:hypothetical protein